MSASQLFVHTRDQLLKQRLGVVEQLATGKARDYPEYKKMVGIIEGIDRSLKQLRETLKTYHSGDIDEDE